MAYMIMAYIIMACIVLAYIVMAYIGLAYIVMAYIGLAYISMATGESIVTIEILSRHTCASGYRSVLHSSSMLKTFVF